MKILIVSQYYPPEAVPIPADVAHGLAERGHSVRVLTGYPNYPAGVVFPGYRQKWRGREVDGNVSVCRVPLYADHSQSVVRRLANYVSFALSSATATRFARGADVIYVYATQMTAATGPWLWRFTGGAPYVLHVQDLWPDSIVGSSLVSNSRASRLVPRIVTPWLRNVYRRAGAAIGIAPTMVSMLVERGVDEEHAHLVYNWADTAGSIERPRTRETGQTEILYAGNVGDMQDLGTAVRAAHAAADAGVVLTIVGDGVARNGLRDLAEGLGCTNVVFRDPVPRDQMPGLYCRADYALVSLKDLPAFRGTIPSKMQAVLAAGVPVVSTVQGDVREFVENERVGVTADAENVDSLESAMRRAASLDRSLWDEMAQRAKAAYVAHFSREPGISRIEAIFTAVAAQSDGAR